MKDKITTEDLKQCHMEPAMFGDLAKGGRMQIRRCKEHPRLMVSTVKHDRESPWVTTYMVDGREIPKPARGEVPLQGIVDALNKEPGNYEIPLLTALRERA